MTDNKHNFEIIAIGSAIVDTEIQVSDDQIQQLGITKSLMTLVDQQEQRRILDVLQPDPIKIKQASGGSAGNSIYAASLFGSKSAFICKVANDANGQLYQQDMQAAAVTLNSNEQNLDGVSGQCIVLVTADAERTMCTDLGISTTLSLDNLHRDWNASHVYIESYLATSPSAVLAVKALVKQTRSTNASIALSLSDPGIVEHFKTVIVDMVDSRVDWLFCNRDEAQCFCDTDDEAELHQKLLTFSDSIAMTDGANGAYIINAKQSLHCKGVDTEAVDTNGAGDMFAGAFLAALSKGKTLQQAGDFACHAASRIVSVFGPRLDNSQYQELTKHFL